MFCKKAGIKGGEMKISSGKSEFDCHLTVQKAINDYQLLLARERMEILIEKFMSKTNE